jgi:hypothetical protein
VFVSDALTLDAPRRTADGYLAVRAKAARVGHYEYTGRDVDPDNRHGLRDAAIVHVARDEATVFDRAAVHSFIGKPITDDHPTEAVTSGNWRDHSRGVVMGAIRDGDHLAFDLVLMDAATIAKVEGGKVELSNGYSAGLEFGDFTASDGTKCQARQTSIAGNHVAIVDRGRAGPSCRIGDAATCSTAPSTILDSLKQEKLVKTMLIDGLTVDMANADTAIATVQTLIAARDAATAKVGEHVATIAAKDRELATKDGEIADLKAKVSDEATLDARADAKAELVTRGKTLLGDKMPDVKGKSLADTRRAIVAAAGITVADKSDDYIEARFDGLKDGAPSTVHSIGSPVIVGDAVTAERQALTDANDFNSWRNKAA